MLFVYSFLFGVVCVVLLCWCCLLFVVCWLLLIIVARCLRSVVGCSLFVVCG